jgi:hypothetical protein
MPKSITKRIEETKTLCDILPSKSASSGHEFGRIVNLLLFHDGRRRGRKITLLDDRSGDYCGLDAFEASGKVVVVGYQHKFYPSPLSDEHRRDVEKSLAKTAAAMREDKIRVEKYVLVTPQNLVESGVRKTGGDATWFQGLRDKHKLPFEIEHWGHAQLQALFLETPSIGLFYYPELFADGATRRRTVQQLRAQYDEALTKQYGRIEFVGMSVYKEEAARAVPMENIYIPLRIIGNGADENDPNVPRRNSLELLVPGTRHVVLGDPGSGKTTLLRFLALFGRSKLLQRRYGPNEKGESFRFQEDERLPVLVTLRRYADVLKSNDNLSLVDYIRGNIEADFSIAGLSMEFFEYYLESGKTVLLFDGLDELPTPSFRQKIRNRIQNMTETYPGNTTIVTSRIYSYQGPVRFHDKEFLHHRLAKLSIEEMEQFVHDWYDARLEKPRDRTEYLNSLIGILRNEEHEAIRELARNPLLLTIMVLVHRIDAVLPDERHVLYQKCTETLLNTWHTWKFHDMDRLHRAKVDRQNMHRMQAVAYWMQHEMGGARAEQQAVVPYEALHRCLTKHIKTETPPNLEYSAEDIATAFLEFVQDRAGLLVEIGTQKFSFVHLTFQEYLTAAQIRTLSELNGVKTAWGKEIKDHCLDPRWREVLRLLVAGYGSNESQEFLVDRILSRDCADTMNAQLLGGLLLDGVAAAQMRKAEVFRRLVLACSHADDDNQLKNTVSILRACSRKADADGKLLQAAVQSLTDEASDVEAKTRLRLSALSAGMKLGMTWRICGRGSGSEAAILSLLAGHRLSSSAKKSLQNTLELLWCSLDVAMLTSPSDNFVSAALQSLSSGFETTWRNKRAFEALLTACATGWGWGPAEHFVYHTLLFSPPGGAHTFAWAWTLGWPNRTSHPSRSSSSPSSLRETRSVSFDRALGWVVRGPQGQPLDFGDLDPMHVHRGSSVHLGLARARVRRLAKAHDLGRSTGEIRVLGRHIEELDIGSSLGRVYAARLSRNEEGAIWQQVFSDPLVSGALSQFLCKVLDLAPTALWGETLRTVLLPTLPKRIHLVDPEWWRKTCSALKTTEPTEDEIYAAAWQLMFDGMLYLSGYYEADLRSLRAELQYTEEEMAEYQRSSGETRALFSRLAEETCDSTAASLRIGHCIRDLAYGKQSRARDLRLLLESEEPQYREIFERCYWRRTAKRRKRDEGSPRLTEATLLPRYVT